MGFLLGEIVLTRVCDLVVDCAHRLDELFLDLGGRDDLEVGQEVIGHWDERFLGPPLEPVDRAAAYQAGEFQRSISKLLANLDEK